MWSTAFRNTQGLPVSIAKPSDGQQLEVQSSAIIRHCDADLVYLKLDAFGSVHHHNSIMVSIQLEHRCSESFHLVECDD